MSLNMSVFANQLAMDGANVDSTDLFLGAGLCSLLWTEGLREAVGGDRLSNVCFLDNN